MIEDSELKSIISEIGIDINFQQLKAKADKLNISD